MKKLLQKPFFFIETFFKVLLFPFPKCVLCYNDGAKFTPCLRSTHVAVR